MAIEIDVMGAAHNRSARQGLARGQLAQPLPAADHGASQQIAYVGLGPVGLGSMGM